MKVTAQMLRDANACENQVFIFEDVWPDGAEINRASVTVAVIELGLDIGWFARHVLPSAAREVYIQAMTIPAQEYSKATGRELAIWDKARAIARKACSQDAAVNWPVIWDKLHRAYKKAVFPACTAYNQAMIEALVLAVETMEGCA